MRARVHPGPSAYNKGCRCDECTELHKLRCRRAIDEMTARGRADPSLIPHGTKSGYGNWGCRCDDCTDEHVAALTDWKRRQKAGTPVTGLSTHPRSPAPSPIKEEGT